MSNYALTELRRVRSFARLRLTYVPVYSGTSGTYGVLTVNFLSLVEVCLYAIAPWIGSTHG